MKRILAILAIGSAACNSRAPIAHLRGPDALSIREAVGRGVIHVRWSGVPDATRYRIYFKQAPDAIQLPKFVDETSADAWERTLDLATGQDWYVAVTALSGGNESPPSPEVHLSVRGLGWTLSDPAPARTVTGAAAGDRFGAAVSIGQDVDGDGLRDVVVGAPHAFARRGTVFLFPGRANGMAGAPLWTTTGTQNNQELGFSVIGAGDLNGDGFGDVVAGSPFQANSGELQAYFGGPSGPIASASSPDASYFDSQGAADNAELGHSLAAIGDRNGDGFADFVAGAPNRKNTQDGNGAVYLMNGDAAAGMIRQDYAAGNGTDEHLGVSVAGGDLDGDGLIDIVAGGTGGNLVKVFRSNSELASNTPSWTVSGPAGSSFGASVAVGRFHDGSHPELAVGAPLDLAGAGVVRTYTTSSAQTPSSSWSQRGTTGSSRAGAAMCAIQSDDGTSVALGEPGNANVQLFDGLTSSPTWSGIVAGAASFGSALASGDVNGDGYDDLVVGDPAFGNGAGRVSLFLGGPGQGVDVTAGPPLRAGLTPVQPLLATFDDPAAGQIHHCHIEWGDGAATDIDPCAPEDPAKVSHLYAPGTPEALTFLLRVDAEDGRSGESATRVVTGGVDD